MLGGGGVWRRPAARRTYYQRTIEPILISRAPATPAVAIAPTPTIRTTSPPATSTSPASRTCRSGATLLRAVRRYPVPLLLVKSVGAGQLQVAYGDEFRDLAGAPRWRPILSRRLRRVPDLLTWMENGATVERPAAADAAGHRRRSCSSAVPSGFDPAPYLANPNFAEFRSAVMPVLAGCNSGELPRRAPVGLLHHLRRATTPSARTT
jgi:hypothetical protein